ncbi:MAG: hypothetical protein ACRDYZ_10815 [Acidimicrobiales bacterium]
MILLRPPGWIVTARSSPPDRLVRHARLGCRRGRGGHEPDELALDDDSTSVPAGNPTDEAATV